MISPLDWGESNLATGETMLFAQRMLETGLRRINEEDEEKEELAADDGWSRPLPASFPLVRLCIQST